MTRRELISTASAAALSVERMSGGTARSKMGVATTCYMTARKFKDTYVFLEHCGDLGAGGIQSAITSLEPEYLKKVRSRAEELGMWIEVIIALPRDDSDRFSKTVAAARELGANCVRANCGGRRYEDFSSLEEWQKFVTTSFEAIARALPVVEKHQMPLAIENHKEWTVHEMEALLKKFSHPLLGVCLDTGNNMALLEEPMTVIERLAPYAITTHIKDMGVQEYPDGFLLSEVVLGQGILDLPKALSAISSARPKTKFVLEMITRDPLKVPCLTDRYWVTFPNRPGSDLARMLRLVRATKLKSPLPQMTGRTPADQISYEETDVKLCLEYAARKLAL